MDGTSTPKPVVPEVKLPKARWKVKEQMPEYRSWISMKERCRYKKGRTYASYGGRGIKVCERWSVSFEVFLSDMGPRPPGTTLGRIDNDGHYEPGNCRWETTREQSLNNSRTVRLTHNGITKTIKEWAEDTGQRQQRLYERHRRGWQTAAEIIFGRGAAATGEAL